MKKIFAVVLALVLCLSVFACAASADVSNVKLGVILLHDEDSTYDLNFINGVYEAVESLGLTEDQLIIKRNIPESNECYEAALDLVDEGCTIIFADSFGHETFMLQAAKECPDVEFCHATGTMAHTEKLANFHNAFAAIYEGRYLAGIAAGSVVLTDINTKAAAAGTVEAIEAAKTALENGEIKVFNTAADNFMLKGGAKIESYVADVDTDEAFTPDTEVVLDGYFHESEFRSAPYFDIQLDGIELVNSKF